MSNSQNKPLLFLGFIFWAALLAYGIWYLFTGWNEPNAIMSYCSTMNDTALGWVKYVCGHGILNFVAGYGAIFPFAAPILLLVSSLLHKSFGAGVSKTLQLFWSLLFVVAIGACCLYSALFFMETQPLIAGLFILGTIFSALCSCISVYTIIIVVE